LRPTLEAKGWWGRQVVVAPDGGAEVAQLGSPRRLDTIYQTNMQSAYMAGRYAAAYEARETHPYWMYVAVMDGVTRPSHAALHGKVFRWDDPIWQHITPPNGYNCRCRIVALT
ncbi:minor capsid protein, partial [Pseudomonas aeruginosa]|nr:minor capsid protein [Pseudomonas aeruginosa]